MKGGSEPGESAHENSPKQAIPARARGSVGHHHPTIREVVSRLLLESAVGVTGCCCRPASAGYKDPCRPGC